MEMRVTNERLLPALVLLAGMALAGAAAAAEDKEDKGFTDLFNGKDLTGWKFEMPGKADPAKTWSVKDGVIICTGKPNAYFYTDKSFKDYVLRYDWRYLKPEEGQKSTYNSGALIHIQTHKIWPKCVELQGANANHGFLYFLGCKKIGEAKYDKAAKDKAVKPIGQWNTTEITCKADGTITASINGVPVSSGKSDLTEGSIGFQSEGAVIEFRKIRIKNLK
jgi:hypothetical protein